MDRKLGSFLDHDINRIGYVIFIFKGNVLFDLLFDRFDQFLPFLEIIKTDDNHFIFIGRGLFNETFDAVIFIGDGYAKSLRLGIPLNPSNSIRVFIGKKTEIPFQ